MATKDQRQIALLFTRQSGDLVMSIIDTAEFAKIDVFGYLVALQPMPELHLLRRALAQLEKRRS